MKILYFVGILLALTSQAFTKEWYEGGTLHKKSALDWQTASYENKLATCSDFIAQIWQKKGFTPKMQNRIKTLDDIKEPSKELVEAIDAAFKKMPNEELNEKMYTNQSVSSTAVLLMAVMKWIE